MNVVLFLCPMALNLYQKRPSPVTFGWLFHRAIRREIAAPSFVLMAMVQQSYLRHPPFHRAIRREIAAPSSVLMGDGAAKLPPSSAIPPRNTTRNRSTIVRFDGDGARKLPPSSAIPPRHATRNSSAIIRFDGDGAAKLPPSSAIPPRHATRNSSAIIRFDGRWCKGITPLGLYF